jgi:hypothetical protein
VGRYLDRGKHPSRRQSRHREPRARAERLTEKLFADAATAGFSKFETEEERERVTPLVLAAVADSTDFDVDAYKLKSQLAMENEDGD